MTDYSDNRIEMFYTKSQDYRQCSPLSAVLKNLFGKELVLNFGAD